MPLGYPGHKTIRQPAAFAAPAEINDGARLFVGPVGERIYNSLRKLNSNNMTSKVICIVLGGGQGSRLSPLTATRSKPAVPIAGKYRLVDIPISNCLHSGIHRIYVLTQFNSASLNKHIKNTYHFSNFSEAFVDILAAEQTPSNVSWFQGCLLYTSPSPRD